MNNEALQEQAAINLCRNILFTGIDRAAAEHGNIAVAYAVLEELLCLTYLAGRDHWMAFVTEALEECKLRALQAL